MVVAIAELLRGNGTMRNFPAMTIVLFILFSPGSLPLAFHFAMRMRGPVSSRAHFRWLITLPWERKSPFILDSLPLAYHFAMGNETRAFKDDKTSPKADPFFPHPDRLET